MMAIADIRREYRRGHLERADLEADPLAQFDVWFAQAAAAQAGSRWLKIGVALYKLWQAILGRSPADVNAMVLSTVDKDGRPSSRNVLLKGADARGFIFFTNYDSRKSLELSENPNASLTFYWPELERQVCVAGPVEKISRDESETYFKSRPRGSKLAAWASNQSDVVPDRAALEAKWNEMERKFPNDVPLPPNWGGFVLKPERIEFWQGRPSRLHDRFQYTLQPDKSWKLERLAP
ncbi:MAG TPA: pyridoxamine 5'-phosphate oxidase [Candidatus Paceibacterota bacterium]|nr:pyridoxamine 5'-phosphate oxidase [Candidatus Paceibacterota bacterium]